MLTLNPKTCPKCGENNPPEAVMCWACYTPLGGGAGAAGPGGGGGKPTIMADEPDRKPIPAGVWFGGGVGALALVLVGIYFLLQRGGPVIQDIIFPAPASGTETPYTSAPVTEPPGLPGGSGNSGAPSANVQVAEVPFITALQPNPRINYATMAIVPKQATSLSQAAGMAKWARTLFVSTRRWASLEIFVFSDKTSAQVFAEYQADRKGRPLEESDYVALRGLWPSCLAWYRYRNGKEYILYPSRNAQSWWNSST